MAKAIDKDYLLTQFRNFDSVVLENKYLQDGEADLNVIETVKVNGTALTPDANKAVNVEAVTGVTMNGSSSGVTITGGVADLVIPAATQYKIAQQASPETGYFATYTLQANTGAGGTYEDVTGAAKINIPKDFVVRDASLNVVVAADKEAGGKFENDPSFVIGDKYIDLEVNTVDAQDPSTGATHLYINLKDLTDVYTAGNGLALSNAGEFSVNAKANGGLIADATGLYIDFEPNDGTDDIDFENDWEVTP